MKKIYKQKFEANKLAIVIISVIVGFMIILFLLGPITGKENKLSIIYTIVTAILYLYFMIYVLISAKKNKLEVYDDHIEIEKFNYLWISKYNLKLDEIKKIYTVHNVGWNIEIILKNNKCIKIGCLPIGKGTYNESKKFLEAVKKIGF